MVLFDVCCSSPSLVCSHILSRVSLHVMKVEELDDGRHFLYTEGGGVVAANDVTYKQVDGVCI